MKKLIILIIYAVLAIGAKADSIFVHFPASNYPLTSDGIPEVMHQVALTSGQSANIDDYEVRILYPEYAPLTKDEKRIAKKFKSLISPEIRPVIFITTVRKQKRLEVAFIPFVRNGQEYRRLTSCKIFIKENAPVTKRSAKVSLQQSTEAEARYAKQSVLSQGRWVKIAVNSGGMYEITADQLKTWGFHDIHKVRLFGYGGRIITEAFTFEGNDALIDDLCEIPLYRRGSSVLFCADGTTRWHYDATNKRFKHEDNYYSSNSYYFITEGGTPMPFTTAPIEENNEGVSITDRVPHHSLYDENSTMWYEGGRRLFHSHDFSQKQKATFNISTPDIVADSNFPAKMEVSFSAASALSSTKATISANNANLGTITVSKYGNNENARISTTTFKPSNLVEDNSVTISTNNANPARLDYIQVSYMRRLNGAASPFAFITNSEGPVCLHIEGADSGTEIWELTRANQPQRKIAATLEGSTLKTQPIMPNVRYALVNVNRNYPTPTYIGELANQNLHADRNIDMVIVVPTSGKLLEQAERLANIHRTREGLRVKVVTADCLYNEFSSGTPDASAIRRYMKMLYDRAQNEVDVPRFLLLFGNGLADNRMLTEDNAWLNADDYLLCYEVDNSSLSIGNLNSYCTEDYFGFLDDGEGADILTEKLDLAIGRLCATTPEEARILVDKIEKYLANTSAGNWKNDILLIGDFGDNNGHMKDAERVADEIQKTDNRLTIHKAYPDAYTPTISSVGTTYPACTRQILTNLTNGVALVNYSGHGSPFQLSHASILNDSHLKSISTTRYPVWLLASCEIFPFDSKEDNLGRLSMLQEDGGCIAFISPTRSVYASLNNPLNCRLTRYAVGRKSNGSRYTLGEAMMNAKVDMVSTQKDMNKMKFAIIGDPAITLGTPNGEIVLDSINGKLIPTEQLTLNAGSIVRFSGHICKDGTDELCSDFNGQISLRIFDCERTTLCKGNGSDEKFAFTSREECVFSGTTSVIDGKFTITTSIPLDIAYSKASARVSCYAWDSNYSRESSGIFEHLSLHGTDSSVLSDDEKPAVLLYFENEEFPNGGVIGTDALLQANISDNLGINTSTSGLGHDMLLIIDNDTENAINVNEYFFFDFGSHKSGHLAYPLKNLAPGPHSLALQVWDLNNNCTIGRLDVLVSREPVPLGVFSVTCNNNPVGSTSHIAAQLPADHQGGAVEFTISDTSGLNVWSAEVNTIAGQRYLSIPWNGCSKGGAPLPTGIYLLQARLGKERTKTQKLIVRLK